ncbi:hypothetical protein EXIGLDRAFT_833749 [Exidia glandulosa HHB12029]|uniref:Uncharacterized protein n=1 Tax=Exidia glandulosa HHB12029 TaxID=1314781 RepID=A0A165KFJ4_EXIGL|nr:hypothetical protein EXIGLDRAFT_833749 [Exidia glandulosa HHB12029]
MPLLDIVDHTCRQHNDIVSHAVFWSGCLALVIIMVYIRPVAHARHSELASQPAIVLAHDIVEKGLGEVEVAQTAPAPALHSKTQPGCAIYLGRAAAFSWAIIVFIANLWALSSDSLPETEWSRQRTLMDKLSLSKFILVHQFLNVATVTVWASYILVTFRQITGRAACPTRFSVNRFCEQNRGVMFIAAFLPLLSAVTPTTFERRLPVYDVNGVAVPVQVFFAIQSIVWAVFAAKSCAWQHPHVVVHAEEAKCWNCRTESERWSVLKAKIGRLSGSQQEIRLDDD